jgi:hypothetical protein
MCRLNLNNEKVVESETDEDVENEDETVERDAMNLLKRQNKKLIIEGTNLLCFLLIYYIPM